MNRQWLEWMLKGAAMGAADAVPGVSGGTIALITGVYERFINALAALNFGLVPLLLKGQWRELWQKIDGAFLLSMGIGILTSLFTVLNLMNWALQVAAPVVWALFMGVIVAALIALIRGKAWPLREIYLLVLGTLIASGLAFLSGTVLPITPATLMFGGALAISAMLLPGISGSFMLVLLGLYPFIVEAVSERDLVVIAWVALGCLIGVMSVSQALKWALNRWHDAVISFMIGFVVGALVKVWPWQFEGGWYMPVQYAEVSAQSSWLIASLFAFLVGSAGVWLLQKMGSR